MKMVKEFIKKHWLLLALSAAVFIVCSGGYIVWQKNQRQDQVVSGEKGPEQIKKEPEVKFTHRIFDPAKVSHIVPLGELNGGYIETQTINGVMINLKVDSSRNAESTEIYAPTDMTLEDYSLFPDGNRPAQWHLGFRINNDVRLSFDHISWVPDNIKEVTPPTQNSGYVPPLKRLTFKAGEMIAKTSGTNEAHNFNIYLRDNRHTNTFVNQERYEKVKQGYSFVNAACPFDYYEESVKQSFISLMGCSAPGQIKTCGSPSKDVKGSISGLWHFSKETDNSTFMGKYSGNYASPFSIYKNSANEIIFYEMGKKRYIVDRENSTYKDPAQVNNSHCYNLTEYPGERTKGYAYFKIISDMEMKVSYGPSGSCPAVFPEVNSMTYYR